MSGPMLSLNGEPVMRPISVFGEWAHVEMVIPVLDINEDAQEVKWWANVAHADVKDGNHGGLAYVLSTFHERFFDILGPIAFQRCAELIRNRLKGVVWKDYLPPFIPHPPQFVFN